jgi:hypothetical protein
LLLEVVPWVLDLEGKGIGYKWKWADESAESEGKELEKEGAREGGNGIQEIMRRVRRTLIEGFYLANGQNLENSQVFIRESAL